MPSISSMISFGGRFIVLSSILASIMLACSPSSEKQKVVWFSFGEVITDEGVQSLDDMMSSVDTAAVEMKIIAEIGDVCQAKGCWMTLKTESGMPIRVTFKDYGFFMPKDASGKKVIIQGLTSAKELDADLAKHYADDAGEIYDPSQSTKEISIVASGVLIAQDSQL